LNCKFINDMRMKMSSFEMSKIFYRALLKTYNITVVKQINL